MVLPKAILCCLITNLVWAGRAPRFHPLVANPGIAFDKDKDIAFMQEKWHIFSALPIQFINSAVKEVKLISDEAVSIHKKLNDHNAVILSVANLIELDHEKLLTVHRDFIELTEIASLSHFKRGEECDVSPDSKLRKKSFNVTRGIELLRERNSQGDFGELDYSYFIENESAKRSIDLSNKLRGAVKIMQALKAEIVSEKKIIKIINILNLCHYIIAQLEQLINKISEIMKHQRFFFNVENLTNAIKSIEGMSSLDSPIAPANINAHTLPKFARLNIAVEGDEILFEIILPFISKIKFSNYKIIAFPNFLNNSVSDKVAAYVQPSNDYFATNKEETTTMFISKEQLRTCKEMSTFYLCDENFPLEHRPSCEELLFYNPNYETLSTCDIKIAQDREYYFFATNNPTILLYSIKKTLHVSCNCKNTPYILPLKGNGFLELPSGCELFVKEKIYRGAEGAFDPDKLIVPHLNLVLFNIDLFLRTKNTSVLTIDYGLGPENINNREEMSTKDIIYVTLCVVGTVMGALFLACVGYFMHLFVSSKSRNEKISTENTYVPLGTLDPEFKCEFKGFPIYDVPKTPAKLIESADDDDCITVIEMTV